MQWIWCAEMTPSLHHLREMSQERSSERREKLGGEQSRFFGVKNYIALLLYSYEYASILPEKKENRGTTPRRGKTPKIGDLAKRGQLGREKGDGGWNLRFLIRKAK